MKENRVVRFYIRRWTGWVLTRSSAPCSRPFDLGPGGSGSIQRSWSVLEIRIHQPHGFGPVSLGFCGFFSVFLTFCYAHPYSCYLDPLCVLTFSQKFQKNTGCSLYVCDCFCDIFTCWKLTKLINVNFSFDWYILVFFVWTFLLGFKSKFLSYVFGAWHLISWWFTSDFMIVHLILLSLMLCNISNFVKLELCNICYFV